MAEGIRYRAVRKTLGMNGEDIDYAEIQKVVDGTVVVMKGILYTVVGKAVKNNQLVSVLVCIMM